jgi:hypothetical protein
MFLSPTTGTLAGMAWALGPYVLRWDHVVRRE